MTQNGIVKKCNKCGATYRPSGWMRLPLVGQQETEDMKGEMRNCPCNSTLFYVTWRSVTAREKIKGM